MELQLRTLVYQVNINLVLLMLWAQNFKLVDRLHFGSGSSVVSMSTLCELPTSLFAAFAIPFSQYLEQKHAFAI